jgi:hypothetical protein
VLPTLVEKGWNLRGQKAVLLMNEDFSLEAIQTFRSAKKREFELATESKTLNLKL